LRNRARDARKVFLWLLLALGLPAAAAETTAPQYSSVAPTPDGIGKVYMGREISHVMGFHGAQWLERTERMDEERPDLVLNALDLKPGMTVADIGAGSGLFTQLFAYEVGPRGRVHALEINPVMVNNIVRRAREVGLNNVEGRLGNAKSIPLPAGSLDVAFTSDVYHHFEFPQVILQAIRAALKPGGIFIVVDFERIPGVSSERILSHVRAGKETVIKEVEAEGFRMVEEKKILQSNYFVRFQKQ